jgi:hypothetical protein
MADERTLSRLDVAAWVLIYAGLFSLVLGIASHDETAVGGWSLTILGGVAAVAGIILILVRARVTPRR